MIGISSGTVLRLIDMPPGPGLQNNVDTYRGDPQAGVRNPLLEEFLDELVDPGRDGLPPSTLPLLLGAVTSTDIRMGVSDRQLRAEAIELLRLHGHEIADGPVDTSKQSLVMDSDPRSLIKAGWR